MFSTRTYFNVNEYLVYVYVHVKENLLGGLIQLTPFPVHYEPLVRRAPHRVRDLTTEGIPC